MATKIAVVDTTVRYLSGAYVTNTVRGRRCSCTHSAEEAAKRLGKKIFATGFVRVEELEVARAEAGTTAWRIHGQEAA
ncbi:MAG: hypothetical protein ACT6S0_26860 [Roseateles sp.]|uniref:hypothetical protein n=1 Tax=Roseateles sp. TaxID=1971397 RepID=UPI0040355579